MKTPTVKQLRARSIKATCGINEREVVVAARNVKLATDKLASAGFYIVGTSYGKTPTKKIWYTRPGLL